MGLDIFVYKRCNNCRKMNQAEVYRSENEPFDINNKKHWALLRQVFRQDIDALKKSYRELEQIKQRPLQYKQQDTNINEDIEDYEDEKDFIAQNLKFSDEGAFTFVNCEKCNEPLMFYITSA